MWALNKCSRMKMSFTHNGVSLSRIGDPVSIQESVFSLQHVLHHLHHGVLVELLLCGLWSKNL